MDRHGYEEHNVRLRTLDTLDKWELEDDDQDIRGHVLATATGDRIGVIDELLVDRDHKRVAGVRLEDGRLFPVEPLLIRDDVVVLLGADQALGDRRRYADRGCTVRPRTIIR